MLKLLDLMRVVESCDSVTIVYSGSKDIYHYSPADIDEYINKYKNTPEYVLTIHAIDAYNWLIIVDL